MRILFLSERLPWPLEDGGNIRTYHLLLALASRHEITLVTHQRAAVQAEELHQLRKFCELILATKPSIMSNLLRCLFRPSTWFSSIFVNKNWSAAILNAAQAAVNTGSYDLVYCNHLDTACYLPRMNWPPAVFDSHNCLSSMAEERSSKGGLFSWLYCVESVRLAKLEQEILTGARLTLACSTNDQQRFLSLAPGGTTHVIANGVDCEYFTPRTEITRNPMTLVFLGAMDYWPNVEGVSWFCNEVLPLLHQAIPELKFQIVGRNPTARVFELGSRIGVKVIGRVDDVRPFLWNATAAVVPLLSGGGTRLKILEAMAAGCPIVSTSKGAEGISSHDIPGIVLADSANTFSDAIQELVHRSMQSRGMGRELAKSRYDWEVVGRNLLEKIARIANPVQIQSGIKPI